MASRPTVVVVGAASRDLDPTDARGWRLGGTVTYGSLAMARLGVRVRTLMGVDGEAASAHELGLLLAAGCELELAHLAHGPVFDNQQTPDGRRQIAHDASDLISLGELPSSWRSPDGALLGPVAGELGPAWARVFGQRALVGLGWQGLLRRLRPGLPVDPRPIRPLALIARADLAVVSVEDLAVTPAPAALARLLPRDGQQLLVTNGPAPALLLERSGAGVHGCIVPVVAAAHVADATGAGDVLLATWLAGAVACRAAGFDASHGQLLRLAIVAAAAKVEAAGPTGIPDLRGLCQRIVTPRG